MRTILPVLAVIAILVTAGCGEIVIGQPQTKPEPVPHVPSQPKQQHVEREVLAFTTPWCSACQKDKDEIAELRRKGVKITEINIDERPDLAEQYDVQVVPTYVVLQDGVEVQRTNSIVTILSMVIWLLAKIISIM
jgi:thioredoxin 1